MDESPGGHPMEMSLKCHRCGRYFVWRPGRPIVPTSLLRRPLYCPPCRKLVAQHRIDL